MMKRFNRISTLPEFKKDIKKLRKRFRTIEGDLLNFIKTELRLYHKIKMDNKGIFPIPSLEIEAPEVYKAKKFTCRSLKGKGAYSGIRVIYTYFEDKDRIELIEIYYKGDKKKEERNRILKYCKKQTKR